jgi:hypothetical protein
MTHRTARVTITKGAVTRYCTCGQSIPVFTVGHVRPATHYRRLVRERWREHLVNAVPRRTS